MIREVIMYIAIVITVTAICCSNPPPRAPTMQEIKTAEKLAECLKDAVSDAGTE